MKISGLDTYVYIDVSNIRNACRNSCGFDIDFEKLYKYFENKYMNLKDVRYYEGIDIKDERRGRYHNYLNSVGYTICSLNRKGYVEPAKFKKFYCARCHFPNRVEVLPENVKLKSNVDVYLVADMLEKAAKKVGPNAHCASFV